MTDNELYRSVAAATNESVGRVKRIGFLLADPDCDIPDPDDPDLGCRTIDWDELDFAMFDASEDVDLDEVDEWHDAIH